MLAWAADTQSGQFAITGWIMNRAESGGQWASFSVWSSALYLRPLHKYGIYLLAIGGQPMVIKHLPSPRHQVRPWDPGLDNTCILGDLFSSVGFYFRVSFSTIFSFLLWSLARSPPSISSWKLSMHLLCTVTIKRTLTGLSILWVIPICQVLRETSFNSCKKTCSS